MTSKQKIMSCPTCFSTSVEVEEGDLVCCGCGLVLEINQEFQDDNFEKKSFVFHSSFLSSKRIPLVKKLCLQATQSLGEKLKLNKNMIEQMMQIYREALYSPEFNQCPYQKKLQLGGVCVYLIMLKNNWVIPIDCICNELNCSSSEFNHIYNRFILTFPNHKPVHRSLSEFIPFAINELKFEKEEEEEKKIIEKRVFKLIDLLKHVCSFDGMRPINIIKAVIFISWKSIKPSERNKISLKQFCKKYEIENNPTTKVRYREMVNHLASLLQDIPWIKEPVEIIKKRLAFHVIDILDYSNSLIYHYKKKKLVNSTALDEVDVKSILAHCSKSFTEKKEDSDISDSEIDSYLRSENEIKVIERLKEIQKARD